MLTTALRDFAYQQLDHIIEHYCVDGMLPRRFAGFDAAPGGIGDLVAVLGMAHKAGRDSFAGRPIEDLISHNLPRVIGIATEAFASFRLAEGLHYFGAWAENPLIQQQPVVVQDEVRVAIDSRDALPFDGPKPLNGYPNNFWAVLARCETARQTLLQETTPSQARQAALAALTQRLQANPHGFFDDAPNGIGRYDIYSAEVCCFIEPLLPELPTDLVEYLFQRHRHQWHLSLQGDDAAMTVWGRSTGLYAPYITMELAALCLSRRAYTDQTEAHQLLSGIKAAFTAQQAWWEDGLVIMHRNRNPYGYRGPHRLLSIAIDFCTKLLTIAGHLEHQGHQDHQHGTSTPKLPAPLPLTDIRPASQDHWLALDDQQAGAWYFRRDRLDFQLAAVGGDTADYSPVPSQPGVFEVPVDSHLFCWLPIITDAHGSWRPAGRPTQVAHEPGVLTLRYAELQQVNNTASRDAPTELTYRVLEDGLELHANVACSDAIHASVMVAETDRQPLQVRLDGEPMRSVLVHGIDRWRSFWGCLQSVYEAELSVHDGRVSYRLEVRLAPTQPTAASDANARSATSA
jgi:hypothetical protein